MVEWNGGVDYWSGVVDWITGVPRPQIYNLLSLYIEISSTLKRLPLNLPICNHLASQCTYMLASPHVQYGT